MTRRNSTRKWNSGCGRYSFSISRRNFTRRSYVQSCRREVLFTSPSFIDTMTIYGWRENPTSQWMSHPFVLVYSVVFILPCPISVPSDRPHGKVRPDEASDLCMTPDCCSCCSVGTPDSRARTVKHSIIFLTDFQKRSETSSKVLQGSRAITVSYEGYGPGTWKTNTTTWVACDRPGSIGLL